MIASNPSLMYSTSSIAKLVLSIFKVFNGLQWPKARLLITLTVVGSSIDSISTYSSNAKLPMMSIPSETFIF